MWEKGGIDIISALPAEMLMEADELVDAARQAMRANLSRSSPAARYRAVTAKAVGA